MLALIIFPLIVSHRAEKQDSLKSEDKVNLSEWEKIKKYGGKVLARGPVAERLEGDVDGIVMMIEFESKEAADTFYHSKEYQAAKAVREECSDTDLMIAEGVPD